MKESQMGVNSTEQLPQEIRIFLTTIFPPILILFGILTLYYGGRNVLRAYQSNTWPTVQGVVQNSYVESLRNSNVAKIVYDYTVNEKPFTGMQVAFGSYSFNWSHARGIVNMYPQGKTVSVYYNPQNPQVCVLEPGVKGQVWIRPGIGFGCIAAGILLKLLGRGD
jgi:hypothetical protein